MRVGISIHTHTGHAAWNNSLTQNALFLAASFSRIPFVRSLVLIDIGDQAGLPPGMQNIAPDIAVLPADQVADHVDVVIEMAQGLDVLWLQYLRARGKKVVGYVTGQPFCDWVEPTVFERQGVAARPDRYDAVWLPPQHHALAQMLRALHRCPCRFAPFMWSPVFLEQRIADIYHQGLQYGYVARSADEQGRRVGLRPVIAEPNLSVSRACTVPLLGCDEAYRADPLSIVQLSVLNSLHMKDHQTYLHLVHSLNLFKDRRVALLGAHDIVGVLAQQANAVVSHQWMNHHSYLDLEALYGNYPVVHNANWLEDLGYYYPDFDCEEAGRQLLTAYHSHDQQLSDQSRKVRNLLSALDPTAMPNVQMHADLLVNLVGASHEAS